MIKKGTKGLEVEEGPSKTDNHCSFKETERQVGGGIYKNYSAFIRQ